MRSAYDMSKQSRQPPTEQNGGESNRMDEGELEAVSWGIDRHLTPQVVHFLWAQS